MATDQKSPSESGEWLGRYTLPSPLPEATPGRAVPVGDIAVVPGGVLIEPPGAANDRPHEQYHGYRSEVTE